MKDNIIKLEKNKNILKLEIFDENDKSTGEFLKFNLKATNLLLKLQDMAEKAKKNKNNLKAEIVIIEKRQDVKGKKLLSKNQEDILKALNNFVEKQIEVYNGFLGENGVQKLLNGTEVSWDSFEIIDKYINEQIAPYLELNMKNITKEIKEKYNYNIFENDVLK